MDALLAAIARKPRMLMFSNPMNPVGSWLTPLQLAKVVAALDPETLIVVDEAYAEYAAGDDYPSAAEVLKVTGLNWVVLRTFSKAYGLAGLRIGYGIVSDGSLCDFSIVRALRSTPMRSRKYPPSPPLMIPIT